MIITELQEWNMEMKTRIAAKKIRMTKTIQTEKNMKMNIKIKI